MRRRGRALVVLVALVAALFVLPVPSPTGALVRTSATYRNPVFDVDFPDPHVLPTRGIFAAYATNRFTHVQVATSPDMVTWVLHGEALPVLPNWAQGGYTWAPSVVENGGGYLMYFTARHATARVPCIGVATSSSPRGPFVSTRGGPIMCQPDRGGSIDPSVFRDDDGSLWLVWKSEGHIFGEPTRIWSQRLSTDGMNLLGRANYLLRTDQAWEHPIIENPAFVRIAGRLHLFYSGNRWETAGYAINYAVCNGPAGPCGKHPGPWVSSNNAVAGPGGAEFMRFLDGTIWMSYHGWAPGKVGYPGGRRSLRIDRVAVFGGRPFLSPTSQPRPFG